MITINVKWLLCCFLFFSVNLLAQQPAYKVRYENTIPKPVLTRGPYLQVASSTGMMIRWRTATSARSRVLFGTEEHNLNRYSDDSALVTEHKVTLNNLAPSTKYYYSIGSFNDTLQQGSANYFETLPLPGKEAVYRIGVFGDCGSNFMVQKNVRDQFKKYLGRNYMNSWILLGDNAYENGTDAQFQSNFFEVYQDEFLNKYPLFPAPGNHEYGNVDFSPSAVPERNHEIAYYQNFSLPIAGESGGLASQNPSWYSFDIGNVHFLSLDSHGKAENGYRLFDTLSEQVLWIKRDLAAIKNKGWIVAYFHHPPYSMGSHNSDTETDLVKIRGKLLPILERFGVDLVLCGHSHLYERSKLMKGHYGPENSFNAAVHQLSSSTGFYDKTANSCPYLKDSSHNEGIVYVVAGSAGKISETQTSYPHDAMEYSNAINGGAVMLEVNGNRLDLKWICDDGVIRDRFTMMKDVHVKNFLRVKKNEPLTLSASFTGDYRWNANEQKTRSIEVVPVKAKSVYVVQDVARCITESFEVTVSK